jgi:hAT family C-terminal dimerisation region
VNTLFESVFRIYEQQHNEVDYSCLNNFYLNYNYLYMITKFFFFNQTRVASSLPAPTNPSTRGNRYTMSRIQSILRKNSGSSSTFIPHATNSEIQIFANFTSEYGNIKLDDEKFSILQYWHQVKDVFPILASMTCDIFVVPVSTVASESCFSAANRVLTDKRTRLGENVFRLWFY